MTHHMPSTSKIVSSFCLGVAFFALLALPTSFESHAAATCSAPPSCDADTEKLWWDGSAWECIDVGSSADSTTSGGVLGMFTTKKTGSSGGENCYIGNPATSSQCKCQSGTTEKLIYTATYGTEQDSGGDGTATIYHYLYICY